MTPEMYEIPDTAVKIGLGAIISVCGAMLIAHLDFGRQMKKDKRTRTISLLEDLASKIGTSKYKLDEAVHSFWEQVSDPDTVSSRDAIKKSMAIYLESIAAVGQAQAISGSSALQKYVASWPNTNDWSTTCTSALHVETSIPRAKNSMRFSRKQTKLWLSATT